MTEATFEDALRQLEEKVEALSRDTLALDEALQAFEEGVALYRRCSELLAAAELRVNRLVEDEANVREVPLEDVG
jgi:exodeoxyribonuclease VII small subunit